MQCKWIRRKQGNTIECAEGWGGEVCTQFKLPHQCLLSHDRWIPHLYSHTSAGNSAQLESSPETSGRENVEGGSVTPGHSREEWKHQISWYKDVLRGSASACIFRVFDLFSLWLQGSRCFKTLWQVCLCYLILVEFLFVSLNASPMKWHQWQYLLVEILSLSNQMMQQVQLTVGNRALRRATEGLQASCENAVATGSKYSGMIDATSWRHFKGIRQCRKPTAEGYPEYDDMHITQHGYNSGCILSTLREGGGCSHKEAVFLDGTLCCLTFLLWRSRARSYSLLNTLNFTSRLLSFSFTF